MQTYSFLILVFNNNFLPHCSYQKVFYLKNVEKKKKKLLVEQLWSSLVGNKGSKQVSEALLGRKKETTDNLNKLLYYFFCAHQTIPTNAVQYLRVNSFPGQTLATRMSTNIDCLTTASALLTDEAQRRQNLFCK